MIERAVEIVQHLFLFLTYVQIVQHLATKLGDFIWTSTWKEEDDLEYLKGVNLCVWHKICGLVDNNLWIEEWGRDEIRADGANPKYSRNSLN